MINRNMIVRRLVALGLLLVAMMGALSARLADLQLVNGADYAVEAERRRFATIPVLKRNGEYVGTITEGDILWGIKNLHGLDLEASEDVPISSFPRRRDYKAVTVTTDMPSLLQAAIDQNFVPVVDDRNVFIGMVRRTVILRDVYNKYGAKLDKPRQNTYTHA